MTSTDIYIILSSKPHNPHYLKRYINFISSCVISNDVTDITQVRTENHHICPKSNDMFPEYKSLFRHPWNAAFLTIKQHNVAHHILWKAYKNKSMTTGFYMRVKIDGVRLTVKEASVLREQSSAYGSGKNNPFYGKTHTDETKEKMRTSNIGKKYSVEVNNSKGRSGKGNYFYDNKFLGENNGFFERVNVYDILTNEIITISSDNYQNNKNVRYHTLTSNFYRNLINKPIVKPCISGDSNPMINTVLVFDINMNEIIKLSKIEYQNRDIVNPRYHHINSKFYKRLKQDNVCI